MYQPRKISVERLVEWMARKIKVLGEDLPKCHFIHHKFHMIWPGLIPGQLQWAANDCLSYVTAVVTRCHEDVKRVLVLAFNRMKKNSLFACKDIISLSVPFEIPEPLLCVVAGSIRWIQFVTLCTRHTGLIPPSWCVSLCGKQTTLSFDTGTISTLKQCIY